MSNVDRQKLVVITGAAGFIGTNLVRHLSAAGWRLARCDRASCSYDHLCDDPSAEWVAPDMLLEWLEYSADKVGAVIHLGAISDTAETNIDLLNHWNSDYTIKLWELACRSDWRFLYASSAATYGDGREGFCDDADMAYLNKLKPLNPYGWSKHLADCRIAADWASGKACPAEGWAGFKFFNVYGPFENHKGAMRSLIAKIVPTILADEKVQLFKSHHKDYADGGQLRDFIHVKDVCAVLERALLVPEISGLYNVGTGIARSFLDLTRATYAALQRQPDIEFIPTPQQFREQYQYYTCADVKRIESHGLLANPLSLEKGVADYVQILRNETVMPDD